MRIRLFPALAAVFIGLPLLDALVLILLGRYMGFWTTLALVLISGFLGAGLAKSQGTAVWRGIQRDLAEGRVPAQGLVDGAIIMVAGGLLAAPGFVTDILGLVLLIPAVRVPVKNYLRRRIEQAVVRHYGM
ncbi:MAG TPA: FxsA family protein [Armatimonadota bacterium]|nr:FxsA family protein [Armatimonadota bacterium]